MLFECLPVELIAEILGELDLKSLVTISYLSRRLYLVASDSSLNPWRRPILVNLRSHIYEDVLKHLSVRCTVPRQNWIEILSLARPSFILYEATLPNLKGTEWEECFNRRFLPGWRKWKKDGTWKEAFLKVLFRVWHRGSTTCTADEAWTKYIVLNRNGSANELEISSRNFNPLVLFNEMKLQNNLAHLETRIRLVVEFMDVRILAFGTMARPRSAAAVNVNAHLLLHPPGIETGPSGSGVSSNIVIRRNNPVEDHGIYPIVTGSSSIYSCRVHEFQVPQMSYSQLTRPIPATTHVNYPFYTPGGCDVRWKDTGDLEEEGLRWVGSLMLITQIIGHHSHDIDGMAPGRQHYASFAWDDLAIIAPWLGETITKRIDGPGLGN